LVPGCDEACTVGIEEDGRHPELVSVSQFLVGPNPARDYINVYITPTLSKREGVVLVVHDVMGNLIKSFNLKHDDTTYMLDTSSLANGEYILSLINDGFVLQTKRVVVTK
jgi:hypothetical protein